MKAFAIIKETASGENKGAPDLTTPYSGFVFVGDLPGQYACYLITGSAAQLTAIQAEPNCLAGAVITDDGTLKWPEMTKPVPAGMRSKVNAYLTAAGKPPLAADATLLEVAKLAAPHFANDGSTFDVFDADTPA